MQNTSFHTQELVFTSFNLLHLFVSLMEWFIKYGDYHRIDRIVIFMQSNTWTAKLYYCVKI